ncbi:acyl dehydratase [Alkalihalobacterium alkalinitrilicum]|uniref:acyl dehydratase n=1 Tax=Alkalihalobacterium alkalinitrilicum TaxID=427920 RepID=UPI000995BB91|nr:acyl dehydratase [Alkalihalobacterium alkalinitrilicum]
MKRLNQRYWDDVSEGDEVPSIDFPISVYRLVMEAGANRDFNSIHHNTEYAQSTGAEEMYANNFFLQGMWERTVREYIGLSGTIRSLKGFRMKSFNYAGDTVVTKGIVKNKWYEEKEYYVELQMWSENSKGISVGPGSVFVTLPKRND